jgi:hypothetical protein
VSAAPSPVSDMLVTVKSREVQRAVLAEMRADRTGAARHFLAAAHLELALAEDYTQAGEPELSLRSRLSAASCFWRGGEIGQARLLFDGLAQAEPARAPEVEQVRSELEQDYPAPSS